MTREQTPDRQLREGRLAQNGHEPLQADPLPDTLPEAERLLDEVTQTVVDIQGQLSEPVRFLPDGSRMSPDEFWRWRARAKVALRHALTHKRALKRHCRQLQVDFEQRRREGRGLVPRLVAARRAGEPVDALLDELVASWRPER